MMKESEWLRLWVEEGEGKRAVTTVPPPGSASCPSLGLPGPSSCSLWKFHKQQRGTLSESARLKALPPPHGTAAFNTCKL